MTIDLDSQMHWARWGDPARSHPVSDSMRELIELFLGELTERPAVPQEEVRLPEVGLTGEQQAALAGIVGEEHVHADAEWRIARTRLGPAVAPREIDFRSALPRTRSGKIMRRLLKARELGLPEGDLSTLESDER